MHLSQEQLEQAVGDESTNIPEDLTKSRSVGRFRRGPGIYPNMGPISNGVSENLLCRKPGFREDYPSEAVSFREGVIPEAQFREDIF
jgi:hypothetical protein